MTIEDHIEKLIAALKANTAILEVLATGSAAMTVESAPEKPKKEKSKKKKSKKEKPAPAEESTPEGEFPSVEDVRERAMVLVQFPGVEKPDLDKRLRECIDHAEGEDCKKIGDIKPMNRAQMIRSINRHIEILKG